MKQTCENDHTVIVNNGTFNGNINTTTTINHYHISTVTPSCHFQSKETIQNDLQLDQSNTIAMDLLDLAITLMLQHLHCQRSSVYLVSLFRHILLCFALHLNLILCNIQSSQEIIADCVNQFIQCIQLQHTTAEELV